MTSFIRALLPATLLLLLSLTFVAPASQAQDRDAIASALLSVTRLEAEVPADARTASFLGTRRAGTGIVIDDSGLVLTVGYLIL